MLRSTLFLALALAACSRGEKAETGEAADGTQGDDSAEGAGNGSVKVVVTGGAHAGTYDVASGLACIPDYGPLDPKAFGGAYFGDFTTQTGVVMVDMIVRDKGAAAAGGTSSFAFNTTVNPKVMEGATYRIDPEKEMGSGKATIQGSGDKSTVRFEGTTKEGVKIDATVRCGGR